jgi:hypothetical protein
VLRGNNCVNAGTALIGRTPDPCRECSARPTVRRARAVICVWPLTAGLAAVARLHHRDPVVRRAVFSLRDATRCLDHNQVGRPTSTRESGFGRRSTPSMTPGTGFITDVFSADLVLGAPLAERCAPIIAGRPALISSRPSPKCVTARFVPGAAHRLAQIVSDGCHGRRCGEARVRSGAAACLLRATHVERNDAFAAPSRRRSARPLVSLRDQTAGEAWTSVVVARRSTGMRAITSSRTPAAGAPRAGRGTRWLLK